MSDVEEALSELSEEADADQLELKPEPEPTEEESEQLPSFDDCLRSQPEPEPHLVDLVAAPPLAVADQVEDVASQKDDAIAVFFAEKDVVESPPPMEVAATSNYFHGQEERLSEGSPTQEQHSPTSNSDERRNSEEVEVDVGRLQLNSPPLSSPESSESAVPASENTPPPPPQDEKPRRTGIKPPTQIKSLQRAAISRAEQKVPDHSIETPKKTPASPAVGSRSRPPRNDSRSATPKPAPIVNSGSTTPRVNAKYANTYDVKSKVGSLEKADHTPGGGNVKIESIKLNFGATAKPRVASKTDYTPAKSEKKIISQKLEWTAASKVGSLQNANHRPQGGNVQILNQKLDWKAESKVGSKDNIRHKPGGGNVKIFDEKLTYVSAETTSRGKKRRSSSVFRTSMPGAVYPLTADQVFAK
ncbi:unnamed protein product [Caenorhabditis auriculariae]|uniref:Microtubule-associated protein n=1 Tax=Caenorhabditis auriculariae TaxID=2777116 RepID=A0A8S1GYD3_9PELO|nr:unnamed protein product [Caenorhabditis auriculariae]